MIDFSQVLNPEQCAAATASDGPMLVLAAAGTGKTRTLVHRVAYLVERGVPPSRILLLTFTNRAAREMLERAEKLVPDVGGLWGGTFHSICARLLRRYAALLGYKPGFDIIDEDDQRKIVTDAIKDLAKRKLIADPKDFLKPSVILGFVSDAANRERELEQVVRGQQTRLAFDVDEVMRVCEAYVAKKRELGAMDFDDLLVNGLRLLRECPDVCAELQERFLHVLVDEYQDTNTLQAQFTDLLAARHRNLMVVGDDFQCIYTWRGAEFENIMRFPERWPGCRVLKLERNYRSMPPILDLANVVMKDVSHQFEKTLRPFRGGEAIKPQLFRMWDSRAQADLVLRVVARLRELGYRYSDIACLYRSHFTSIDIQMTLARAKVPFRITSGVGVFEQLHVKDVLAFLRVCLDPHAELSFLRLVRLMPAVGETTAVKLWNNLGKVFDAANPLDLVNLESLLPARAMTAWEGIKKAFAAAPDHLANHEDRLLVEDFTRFFYADHLRRAFEEEDAESRLEDLGEITTQIAAGERGLAGFLEEVALLTNLDAKGRGDVPEDHMHLTTVHQAKGMEWPVVILPWLVDGIFPSSRSVDDGNTDEERRLFYVAVTRAKDRLYLLVPRTRKTSDGGQFPVEPSVFIREIPAELVDEHEVRTIAPESAGGYGGRGDVYGGYGARYGRRDGGGSGGGASYGPSGRGRSEMGYKTTWRR